MADQADVEVALASLIANALYPAGTAGPSVTGAVYRVYRGYPAAPVLDADIAAGIMHITVTPASGEVKNVTKYPRIWQAVEPVPDVLSVTVDGFSATFTGVCAVGQLAGMLVNGTPYPYAVQATDSPATVASNLAAQLQSAGWIVNYRGSTVGAPEAETFAARVVAGAGALQEIKRQAQEFRVSMWCPDPAARDMVAPLVDVALADIVFLPLADGSYGRIRFAGASTTDGGADASLYRRDLVYSVEYPTTLSQVTPAMMFGTAAISVNGVLLGNYQD